MPRAFTQNFYHLVYSTKRREPVITPDLATRLYPYIGGILRDLRCSLLAVNGMADHIHLLVRYPPDLSHSDMVQHVKGRSTGWVHDTFPALRCFAWQTGYGGFTVSKSAVPDVKLYIEQQQKHHANMDFKEEFLKFLRLHEIEFSQSEVFWDNDD